MEPVAGVDGCRAGWVVAVVRATDEVTWEVAPTATAVLDLTRGCAAVGVDIPMGLPDTGRRACDVAARRRLGRAGSAVFPAPPRAALADRSTPGVSPFTWSLVPKIVQWDQVSTPRHVLEVHPEVSFRAMAPGTDLAAKKSAKGALQRLAVLGRWLDTRTLLVDPPAGPGLDDLLDALACAWSARRWTAGSAVTLGGEVDAVGRAMRIVV